ncbi:hypothetical protein GGR55DRAFT_676032 [Xylaria sp. FL0064]|nr:hypothetical protein GGR55DRAFT_676032 [Xylaria sp. FL0064]
MRRLSLLVGLQADVTNNISPVTGKIALEKLAGQPLTQSMHADILRLALGAEELVLTYSRTGALGEEARARNGAPNTALEQFDAEKFLDGPGHSLWVELVEEKRPNVMREATVGSRDKQFSLEGLAGVWVPFGGGDRMCPGRHYAKTEMTITSALLLDKFDLELMMTNTSAVRPNLKFAPFGSLPPTCALPFRIRRKTVSTS